MTGYLDPGSGALVAQAIAGLGCVLSIPVLIIVAIRVSAKNAKTRATAAFTQNPPPQPGRWYADPTGRYAQRWWTGTDWSDEVVLASGQQTTDPTPLPNPPPRAPGGGKPARKGA